MLTLYYLVYIAVSAIVLALLKRGSSLGEWLVSWVIVSALPVVGWLLPLFWPKRLYLAAGEGLDEYMLQQHEEQKVFHVGIYSEVEAEKERNVIPIEEALLVNEHQVRRRVMIDVLKQDTRQYLEILQAAVRNEDTETSHYAVSAIMEVKRKLLLSIQELSVEYENDKEDLTVIKTYAEVLQGFLRSGFLDERTYKKYQYTYLELLMQWTQLSPQDEEPFREKLETELSLGMVSEAEMTGLRFIERHPSSEDAYLGLLKVYFQMRSSVKLMQALEQLKQSPVKLSNRALTMVRFWSEGAQA